MKFTHSSHHVTHWLYHVIMKGSVLLAARKGIIKHIKPCTALFPVTTGLKTDLKDID